MKWQHVFFLYTKVHPEQGSKATQIGGSLLKWLCRIKIVTGSKYYEDKNDG